MIYIIQAAYYTMDFMLAFYGKSRPPATIAMIYLFVILCVWYSHIIDQFVETKWPFQLFVLAMFGFGLYSSVELWQTGIIGTIAYLPLLISIGISQIIILVQIGKDA